MTTETIAVLANLALTLSVIVAVIFGIVQVIMSNRDRHERLTVEILRNFQTREFSELMVYTQTAAIPETYEKFALSPKEERVSFIQFMQQMESLGILLSEKQIDYNLVDKTLGLFVVTTWEKYKPFILDAREKVPDPYLSEYFQWMAEQIDQRMKKNPRPPFFQSSVPLK